MKYKDALKAVITNTGGDINYISTLFGVSEQTIYNDIGRYGLKTVLEYAKEGRKKSIIDKGDLERLIVLHRGLITYIANELNLTTQTVKNYISKYRLDSLVKEQQAARTEAALSVIDEHLENGNFKAAEFVLTRLTKEDVAQDVIFVEKELMDVI